MKVLVTGVAGFVGWHTRARLRALTEHKIVPVGREQWADLVTHANDVDAVIHVAGSNRGSDPEVLHGNINLAKAVAEAVRASGTISRVVYANSIQADNDSPYGIAKSVASDILAKTATDLGLAYVDVRLPNLFGEHGRPQYNSFVATFVDALIHNQKPPIADRPVSLLHVQRAAQALIDGLTAPSGRLEPKGTLATVRGVFDILQELDAAYARGDIPRLLTELEVDLFNTLRAAQFPKRYPLQLNLHRDSRGSLVEVVRSHGGKGQTFVSTTRPGVTRGEHFHLRKVERFVVLRGAARISLRRLFSSKVVSFDVSGETAAVVDIPTIWTHRITNVGTDELTTLFWSNELFDSAAPDTFPEAVSSPVLLRTGA